MNGCDARETGFLDQTRFFLGSKGPTACFFDFMSYFFFGKVKLDSLVSKREAFKVLFDSGFSSSFFDAGKVQ